MLLSDRTLTESLTLATRDVLGPSFVRAHRAIGGGVIRIADGARDVLIEGVTFDLSGCYTGIKNLGTCRGLTIRNCTFIGTIPQTNYLVDLNGDVSDLVIEDCTFSGSVWSVRLRDRVNRARISRCTFTEWGHQSVLIRSGDTRGPQYVTIEDNHFSLPAVGLGFARQMICAYGDPETPASNIIGLRILNNEMVGTREYFDLSSETTRGTGDQIALHRCTDFQVVGNVSRDGGENGYAITRFCHQGLIANNLSTGNDAHGFHFSSMANPNDPLADDSRSTDFLIVNNESRDNCRRTDGMSDSGTGFYIQNAARVRLQNNKAIDTRIPRMTKYGFIVGSSVDVVDDGNLIEFADPKGAQPWGRFKGKQ